MVYIPRISFKTGIGPSIIKTFAMDGKYTGTQKLMLTSSRIFGTKYGGNFRSGMTVWRNERKQTIKHDQIFNLDFQQLKRYMPWIQDTNQAEYYRALNARKQQKKIKKQAKKKKKK